MIEYDFIEGKKRVEEILSQPLEIIEDGKLPEESALTFSNAYKAMVTGVFVDIRDSTTLFADGDKAKVSKVIRAFTSEIIEILRDSEDLRTIGIRGDCVYAIYATHFCDDLYHVMDQVYHVNTFLSMLNVLLQKYRLPNIYAGIGVSTAEELVVKAGRKYTGINDIVWIGKAVTMAANFSSIANKSGVSQIAISKTTFDAIIENFVKRNGANSRAWFHDAVDPDLGKYYHGNIIKKQYNGWIESGMPEE